MTQRTALHPTNTHTHHIPLTHTHKHTHTQGAAHQGDVVGEWQCASREHASATNTLIERRHLLSGLWQAGGTYNVV
jgi:hypothetical protein